MEFDTKQVIEQAKFIETADAILEHAMDPDKDIVEGLESVQSLTKKLDEVAAGTLEVQPPLADERVESYRERAGVIMGIGQRAVDALNGADSDRKQRFGRIFRGVGRAAKS